MENIKSRIIPESMKKNIDGLLEKQLFNANRYYAETNPNISCLMGKELSFPPKVFLQRLISRWNWHNCYYELLLEPAYSNLIKECERELSPEEVNNLIDVYYTSCLVDEATLVMSGSIKKYLEYTCNNIIKQSQNFSDESKQFLITPPTETYFSQYQIEHLYYIYLLKMKDEKANSFKNYLLKKYHANDSIIFESRLKNDFNRYFNCEIDELLNSIKKYKISKEYKIDHFYFTLEHSDRKAIRDIIMYDNLNEKLMASNLIGISGFLLRKKILEYLNYSGILCNTGYIYEFNKDTIITALELLKEERKKNMDKNVHVYKQKGDTCAIACMMMVLEYYKIMEKANSYDEKRYYNIYGSKYMEGTPFAAIAYHFSKNGLDTTIYHSEENLFHNRNKLVSDENFNLAMEEYRGFLKNAESKGTKVINGIDINSDLLKKELQDGNLVIIAGEFSGILHSILLSGYEKDHFIVCDPLYKNKQKRTKKEIDEFMNTSIGKWFISVNDKTKEKRQLLNHLDQFNKEAEKFMKINEMEKKYEKK